MQQHGGTEKIRHDTMPPQREAKIGWVAEMAPEGLLSQQHKVAGVGKFVPPEKMRQFRCHRDDPGKKRSDLIKANVGMARRGVAIRTARTQCHGKKLKRLTDRSVCLCPDLIGRFKFKSPSLAGATVKPG